MNSSGPGTPPHRLMYLIGELMYRFPGVVSPVTSVPPEALLLDALDKLLASRDSATTMVAEVRKASEAADAYAPNRPKTAVMNVVTSEVGELAEEVNIDGGFSYKKAGPDGIVGEGVDAICGILDLIYRHDPTITEAELAQIANKKCGKWLTKLKEHHGPLENP